MTFQQKVIVSFLVFVLLPVFFLGYISTRISTETLQKTISSQTVQTMAASERNMTVALEEVNHFSDYLLSSGDIQAFFQSSNRDNLLSALYSQRQAIAGIMYDNAEVDMLALYTLSGETLYQSNDRLQEQMLPETLMQKMQQARGAVVWQMPADVPDHPFQRDSQLVLMHGRIVNDVQTLEPLGYMMLSIRLTVLDEVFASTTSDEWLVSRSGEVLYAEQRNQIGAFLPGKVRDQLFQQKEGHLIESVAGEPQLFTYKSSSFPFAELDEVWLVSMQPWSALSQDIDHIRTITFSLVLAVLVAAVLFNVLYLRRIAAFIGVLSARMKQVESGDLTAQLPPASLREIHSLSSRFNQMVGRLAELIERIKQEEKKRSTAEFKVLQQQINPHFLYNTLESINALAAMNGQKDISQMTIHLGRLLRISINGADEVPVERELHHVKSYLSIQQIRFGHQFTYDIQVDECLNRQNVLKLILQPLVENAIQHAFRQGEHGHIQITGSKRGAAGFLVVTDNGSGFSQAAVERLAKPQPADKDGGHGVRNVHDRLQLFYGVSYGLMICSDKTGTTIRVSFPIDEGGTLT